MDLMRRLWPICRSLSGPGIRETFDVISEMVDLKHRRVETGAKVYDWYVPKEWTIRDAYIRDSYGRKVVDFNDSNLHVIHYSVPVKKTMKLEELKDRLHFIKARPDAIPYIASYYTENWGFCLSYNQFKALTDDEYEVVIDADLESGGLDFCEARLGPLDAKSVLIDTYCDHPSMANNELSGPVVSAFLYSALKHIPRLRHQYVFTYLPETIGPMCYLSTMGHDLLGNVIAGWELTCCGDPGPFTYKKCYHGDSVTDRVALHALQHCVPATRDLEILEYSPIGGANERQYNAPGFRFPIGALMRSKFGTYPEYHTSDDNLDFVSAEGLSETLVTCLRMIQALETDVCPVNLAPHGEPQLGRRNLYNQAGRHALKYARDVELILIILNYADGEHSMLEIADICGVPIWKLMSVVEKLVDADLLGLPAA